MKSWAWDLTNTIGGQQHALSACCLHPPHHHPQPRHQGHLHPQPHRHWETRFRFLPCLCSHISVVPYLLPPKLQRFCLSQCQFRMWTDFKGQQQCCLVMFSLPLAGAMSSLSSGSKTTPPSLCTGSKYIQIYFNCVLNMSQCLPYLELKQVAQVGLSERQKVGSGFILVHGSVESSSQSWGKKQKVFSFSLLARCQGGLHHLYQLLGTRTQNWEIS